MKSRPIKKEIAQQRRKQKMLDKEWITTRSLLGNDWALYFIIVGGREGGKSYDVTHTYVRQFLQKGRPFYWIRLTEASKRKLLNNNAEKLIDPDLRRRYNLDIVTSGDNVYCVTKRSKPDKDGKTKILEKKLMARVLDLSTFYNDKGSGLYDKNFLDDESMYYNIAMDEMNREANEKNTFDIVYAFANQIENIIRSTKKRVRIVCIGNLLEDASDILAAFNFIPEEFGRYYLRSKRCVIDYIAPSEKYLKRRKGTAADILAGNSSTFTNQIKTDKTLISKARRCKPTAIIKFTKNKKDWFTVWDGKVIAQYNNEHQMVIPMRPYLDEIFSAENRNSIITAFDNRAFLYHTLIDFKLFQKNLELLRK